MDFRKVSEKFWEKQQTYPEYGFIKRRRLHEINYLVPIIEGLQPDHVVDLGCGDGSTTTILRELTDVKRYSCYDISQGLLSLLNTSSDRGSEVTATKFNVNASNIHDLPRAPLYIAMGLLQCCEDNRVSEILHHLPGEHLVTRSAHYTSDQGERKIVKNSDALQDVYACHYRTLLGHANDIEKAGWTVIDIRRAYPDDIESAFGSKQWFIFAKRKSTHDKMRQTS